MTQTDALVLARCAGFAFRAPGFSHPAVPPPLRAVLSFALALALAPGVVHGAPLDGLHFVIALALELAIGSAIGTAAALLYDGAYAGGRLIDDYVGIRGSVPSAGFTAGAGFGRLWSLGFIVAFFLLDGVALTIDAFADALRTLPPGSAIGADALSRYALTLPTVVVRAALLCAGPPLALCFAVQCALAAAGRVVPRFATFTLSFPLAFGAALAVALASLPLAIGLGGRPWIALPFVPPR